MQSDTRMVYLMLTSSSCFLSSMNSVMTRTQKRMHSLSPVDNLKILEYNRHILTKRITQGISFLCEKGTMTFLPRFQRIVLTLPHTQRKGYPFKGKNRNGCGFDHTEGSTCPVGKNTAVFVPAVFHMHRGCLQSLFFYS